MWCPLESYVTVTLLSWPEIWSALPAMWYWTWTVLLAVSTSRKLEVSTASLNKIPMIGRCPQVDMIPLSGCGLEQRQEEGRREGNTCSRQSGLKQEGLTVGRHSGLAMFVLLQLQKLFLMFAHNTLSTHNHFSPEKNNEMKTHFEVSLALSSKYPFLSSDRKKNFLSLVPLVVSSLGFASLPLFLLQTPPSSVLKRWIGGICCHVRRKPLSIYTGRH